MHAFSPTSSRTASGADRIGVGVGVRYGEVLAGDIDEAHRLEYTVLGAR